MSNTPALPDQAYPIDSLDGYSSNGRTAGAPQEGGQSDVVRFLQAVLRYKWVVLIAIVIGAGGGFAAAKLVRPQYEAVGKIWVSDPRQSNSTLGPIREGALTESAGWVQLLKSFTVLDTVVLQRNLFVTVESPADQPLFASFGLKERFNTGTYRLNINADAKTYELATAEGSVVERGSAAAKLGDSRGFVWSPPASLWTASR